MKTNRQKWVVDALLLGGFLVAFYLDLTGLQLHQWLGLAVGLLAAYHLIAHWAWARSVACRFLGRTSAQARRCFIVDAGLLFGFAAILVTGLALSSWLSLPLGDYFLWRNAHVAVSIATLGLVVLKVGLHWRWVVHMARQPLLSRGAARASAPPRTAGAARVSRRSFLALMGTVGAAALLTAGRTLDNGQPAPPVAEAVSQENDDGARERGFRRRRNESWPVAPSVDAPSTGASVPSEENTSPGAAETACVPVCSRGCYYPGSCRRYTDSNGNGRCDLGECI